MGSSEVNILVVDDDHRIRDYIAKVLSVKNWHVDTAPDGPRALELVGQKEYDVVVLDYRMPDMDGAELCRRIREVQPGVRGVFLTGYTTIDTVFPAMQAGAERVLAKPVSAEELVRVLEEQLAESRSHDPERPPPP